MDDLSSVNLANRLDPIALLEEQAITRVPELVPIRYGRMMVSPFTFYRGAALVMASDLARTPRSDQVSQLCGDAHVANFGLYGSPERRLIFDINDFDETHPGPVEWDVKRLCASLEIAGRDRGDKGKVRREAVRAAASKYKSAVLEFAGMNTMDVWYAHIDVDSILQRIQVETPKADLGAARKLVTKTMTRNSVSAMKKLTVLQDGELIIKSDPPLVERLDEIFPTAGLTRIRSMMESNESQYVRNLVADRQVLLSKFRLRDAARKVVGVGSVGTRAWIALFTGKDDSDPLFLQIKEAQESVLERFTQPSVYATHGERVVTGQRLMQAVSDVFLGWEVLEAHEGGMRDYYVRQLRDWKGSVDLTALRPEVFSMNGEMCAWTLAKAHARAGNPAAIAEFLRAAEDFEDQMVEFSRAYADLTESDHAELVQAVADGRIEAVTGV